VTIPTDYTTLQTAVEADLSRSDLTAELPNFIEKGERFLNRRLRMNEMRQTATISPGDNDDTVALPTRYLDVISMRYDDDDWPITKVAVEELDELKDATATRPEHYSITDQIEFSSPQDAARTLTMRYWKGWDIAADDTNTLLTNEPDVYLYAALAASISKTGTHARGEEWKKFLAQTISDLNHAAARTRRRNQARVDHSLVRRARRFNIERGY
jgi:hypothetical protein